jgi:hypothetical protein
MNLLLIIKILVKQKAREYRSMEIVIRKRADGIARSGWEAPEERLKVS